MPRQWRAWVNKPQTEAEVSAICRCISPGTPFGSDRWVRSSAVRLNLEMTLRPSGRPKKRVLTPFCVLFAFLALIGAAVCVLSSQGVHCAVAQGVTVGESRRVKKQKRAFCSFLPVQHPDRQMKPALGLGHQR